MPENLYSLPALADRLDRVLVAVARQSAQIDRLTALTQHINRRLQTVMSDQSHLDSDVQSLEAQIAAISSAVAAIAKEIANLKGTPTSPALDFTGLDKAVADLTAAAGSVAGLEPPAPV